MDDSGGKIPPLFLEIITPYRFRCVFFSSSGLVSHLVSQACRGLVPMATLNQTHEVQVPRSESRVETMPMPGRCHLFVKRMVNLERYRELL